MFCKHCGNQMPDDSVFCAKCGTPVTAAARQVVNSNAQPSPLAQPTAPQPAPARQPGPGAPQPGGYGSSPYAQPAQTPMSAAAGPQTSPLRFVEGILALVLIVTMVVAPYLDLGPFGSMSWLDLFKMVGGAANQASQMGMMSSSSIDFGELLGNEYTAIAIGIVAVFALGVLSGLITMIMTLFVGRRRKVFISWGVFLSSAILVGLIMFAIGQAGSQSGVDIAAMASMGGYSIGPSVGAWCCVGGGLLLGILDIVRGE